MGVQQKKPGRAKRNIKGGSPIKKARVGLKESKGREFNKKKPGWERIKSYLILLGSPAMQIASAMSLWNPGHLTLHKYIYRPLVSDTTSKDVLKIQY